MRHLHAISLLILIPFTLTPVPPQQDKTSEAQDSDSKEARELQERTARKKELLKLMDKLESKLPSDLARKLIVISIKLSTGYCSPLPAKELEDEINKLPENDARKFQEEWKRVREHPEWPYKQKQATPPAEQP